MLPACKRDGSPRAASGPPRRGGRRPGSAAGDWGLSPGLPALPNTVQPSSEASTSSLQAAGEVKYSPSPECRAGVPGGAGAADCFPRHNLRPEALARSAAAAAAALGEPPASGAAPAYCTRLPWRAAFPLARRHLPACPPASPVT